MQEILFTILLGLGCIACVLHIIELIKNLIAIHKVNKVSKELLETLNDMPEYCCNHCGCEEVEEAKEPDPKEIEKKST